MSCELPALGVGIGFREPFRADLFRHRHGVDFLEITADHYFDAPDEKRAELELLAGHFPIIPHGLDLSLGGAEGVDDAYMACPSGTLPHWPGPRSRSRSLPATWIEYDSESRSP